MTVTAWTWTADVDSHTLRTVADVRTHSADLAETLRAAARAYEVASEDLRLAAKIAQLQAGESTRFATMSGDRLASAAYDAATDLAYTARTLAHLHDRLRALDDLGDMPLPTAPSAPAD